MIAKLLVSRVGVVAAIGAAAVGAMPVPLAMASAGQAWNQAQPLTRGLYAQVTDSEGDGDRTPRGNSDSGNSEFGEYGIPDDPFENYTGSGSDNITGDSDLGKYDTPDDPFKDYTWTHPDKVELESESESESDKTEREPDNGEAAWPTRRR